MGDESATDPLSAARARYEREREKRLRDDGLAQYSQLDRASTRTFDHDPWVEPGLHPRARRRGDRGRHRRRRVRRDAHRHRPRSSGASPTSASSRRPATSAAPGTGTATRAACATSSRYIYLPLLEETGYMPDRCGTRRRTGDLRALPAHRPPLRPVPARPVPDRDRDRRRGTTTPPAGRSPPPGATALGPVPRHRRRHPAQGQAARPSRASTTSPARPFHTARWDYGYTGGSPTEPMDRLADKRVGIIGTGATVDPGRAAAGPGGQGGLRLPAHAVGGRRAGQRPDRRRVVRAR